MHHERDAQILLRVYLNSNVRMFSGEVKTESLAQFSLALSQTRRNFLKTYLCRDLCEARAQQTLNGFNFFINRRV